MKRRVKTNLRRINIRKLLSMVCATSLLVGLLPVSAMALSDGTICRDYGDYEFVKVSNPNAGPGEADGINTNDITGFDANRLNSYAWAVASRGKYIYIGTNRTLFGSALNAVGDLLRQNNPNISQDTLNNLLNIISGGDVPTIPSDEDYIPQIIRFDVENSTTKVIYQPDTVKGEDGVLYYADNDGNLIEGADVASETASFRSVIEYKGNLYFGSLGSNMVQLVRVDKDDNAEVVYQTLAATSSLRACCLYGEGEEETVYFGGQDTTYSAWRAYKRDNPDGAAVPMVIRYLNPNTAGSNNEDWSNLVADFNDFGKYAEAQVYRNGGGTVWDLCSYNGKLYVILAYDRGWVMFRGEEAPDDEKANRFGWKWTEVVGDEGEYPCAMDEEIGEKNEELREKYSCSEYAKTLNGAGLLDSTATPFVYNGKMYIGSFDNATCIQSQTVIKLIIKLNYLKNYQETGNAGPTLSQIYAPIYEVLSHPQKIWVMDENEKIKEVDSANNLLKGTTNDYVWRFVEMDGKLYAGTFDSASAYGPYLNMLSDEQRELLKEHGILPENIDNLFGLILKTADTEGLGYWGKASKLVSDADSGFDLLVTEDGENWETVVNDGFGDKYNYGARTLTIHNDELYIGTANPYYGAQLWKMTLNETDKDEPSDKEDSDDGKKGSQSDGDKDEKDDSNKKDDSDDDSKSDGDSNSKPEKSKGNDDSDLVPPTGVEFPTVFVFMVIGASIVIVYRKKLEEYIENK